MPSREIKVGDRVKFTNWSLNNAVPQYFPPPGTIGTVVYSFDGVVSVQWPPGMTRGAGLYVAAESDLEIVEE